MARFVVLSVFTIVCTVQVTHGGTVALQHRDTTLDELKSIDSYVSSALPVLHDGFFIGTRKYFLQIYFQDSHLQKFRPMTYIIVGTRCMSCSFKKYDFFKK